MFVEFVVGSLLAPSGFSPDTPVSPSPQKPTFLNSNSIRNSRATGLSVANLGPECRLQASLARASERFRTV